MRSRTPKMLHDICGRPMIDWTVAAALEAGAAKVVVVGSPDGALDGRLPGRRRRSRCSPSRTGPAGRVLAAVPDLDGGGGPVVVLSGDVPLVTPGAIRALVDAHEATGAAATLVTTMLDDPSGYGRVVRDADGGVERVVETKAPATRRPRSSRSRGQHRDLRFEQRGLARRAAAGSAPTTPRASCTCRSPWRSSRRDGAPVAALTIARPVAPARRQRPRRARRACAGSPSSASSRRTCAPA